jgi:RNA polymerase sigma-70 factor (ECF subfamily)
LGADDSQMILWCREGREEGYCLLLTRYEGYVYSLCYRLTGKREDALDLTQESLIRILNGLDGFQLNRPLKPWLRQVTINTCINFRRRQPPPGVPLDQPLGENLTLDATLAAGTDPAGEVEWQDTRRLISEAIERLPPLYRMVLILRHDEEMSYQDIAAATNLPLGTVKTYLFRARSALRQELAAVYGWEV